MADNNLMNMSMTRSIYIGTDKTAEVIKRKEAAEKERMARCEARMREQEERLARAKNNKENDIRERIRQRQQKELERQKAALDRRCAQLNKLTAKKEEILQKNHQKSSRVLASRPQKKLAFVFGSSTPRELCYLEKAGQQKRSNQAISSNSRGSTPPKQNLRSEPVTSRIPSRFMTNNRVEKVIPSSSDGMTRSVFGSLSSSANNKQLTSPRRKPSAVKKQQTRSPLSSTTSSKNNVCAPPPLMTQSLYSVKSGNNGFSKSGHSKEKPYENVSHNQAKNVVDRQQRRPVIRKKVEDQFKILKSPDVCVSTMISTNAQQPEVDFNLTMEKTFEENFCTKNDAVLTTNNRSEGLSNTYVDSGNKMGYSNFVSNDEVKKPNFHMSREELDTTFLVAEDKHYSSLHSQIQEHSIHEDKNRESIMSDRTFVLSRTARDSVNIGDTTDATLVQISEQDQRPPSSNHSSLEESEVILPKIDRTIPPIEIPPILEEKRNQRLQQVNEILQKIRPENAASPQTIQHSSSNGFTKKDNIFSDTMSSPAISAENPLMSKSADKAALAEFLQRRRMMKQESNGIQGQPQLPGQVSATIVPSKPSVNKVFHSDEKLNGSDGHDNYRTVRTPPEDPHMNGNGGEEIHLPEPTLINFG